MHLRLAAPLLFAALLASAAARADGHDVVKLKDGALYRGTIAENVPNDHVTLLLITGETRRFEMKDVASVGADQPAPPAPAAATSAPPPPSPSPAPEGAALSLTAASPDVTFQLKVGQGEFTGSGTSGGHVVYVSGKSDSYGVLCTAPCETSLRVGTHHIGLSQGDGHVIEPKAPVEITGPGRLDGTYTSNHGTRVAGYVLAIGGGVAGLIVAAVGATSDQATCTTGNSYTSNVTCTGPDHTELYAGLIGGGIAALVGTLIIVTAKDTADIQFTPAGTTPVAKAREGVAFDPRSLVLRF